MKHGIKRWAGIALGVMLGLGATAPVQAQSADALLDLLVKKGIVTQREANEVRAQLDAQMAQTVEAVSKTKASSFLDSLTMSGDFRLRSEFFDNGDQLKPNGTDGSPERWRFRYRLRLTITAELPEWATLELRLASGDGDPVSTNQSFNDTFRKDPINIDAVFVTIHPPGWDWLTVIGGKMDNPLWQPKFNSPMVWDGDVTPEGVAEQLRFALGEHQQHAVFGNFGQYVVDEVSGNQNDAYLMEFQGGVQLGFGGELPKKPRLQVTAAGGYFMTKNLTDQGSYKIGDSGNKGNYSPNGGTNYLADVEVIYGRGEVAWLVSERPFWGTPALVTFSAEYDKNIQSAYEDLVDDQTEAWTAQIQFGKAKKKGTWQVAYQYKNMPADAVWDAVTDSDWGTGGTDRRGHVLKAAYNLQDWWQLGIGAFLTEKISNRPNSGHNTVGSINGADEDLLRIQIDSAIKF